MKVSWQEKSGCFYLTPTHSCTENGTLYTRFQMGKWAQYYRCMQIKSTPFFISARLLFLLVCIDDICIAWYTTNVNRSGGSPTRVASRQRLLLFRLLLFICKSPLSQAERKGLYIYREADEIKVALLCITLDGYGQYRYLLYNVMI